MAGERRLVIVGIVTSPHKDGMTAQLVHEALAGARAAGAQVMAVYLADEPVDACRGCGGDCWDALRCARDPEGTAWHARLQEADGLVMAVPVYCWQLNGLASLFIDRMRWDTGSVLAPRNPRAAFGIACAGGSGTGCVLALQALYRYFYNWAFHGLPGLPVTRFNFRTALERSRQAGEELVRILRQGVRPFASLGAAMAHYEALPYMAYGPLDELRLIVSQLQDGLAGSADPLVRTLQSEAVAAEEALARSDRAQAAEHLSRAYEAGSQAWGERM